MTQNKRILVGCLSEKVNSGQITRAPRRAVTLIEVMISIVLVSTILLVSVTASANLRRNDLQRRNNSDGTRLAHQFLDEITSRDFRDRIDPVFGIETNEVVSDRTTLDDVDDYHNYSQSPPTYRDGTTIEGFQSWTVDISILPAEPVAGGITTASADTQSPLRLVAVVCTTSDGESINASTIVSDVPVDTGDASYERWRRIRLTFPDREVNITTPMRNRPEPIY